MRKFRLLVLLLALSLATSAQLAAKIDSIQRKINGTGETYPQFRLRAGLIALLLADGQLDRAHLHVDTLLLDAARSGNDSLKMISYCSAAGYFDWRTESRPEMEYLLKALRIAEAKYPTQITGIELGLASMYIDLKNYRESLRYLQRVRARISSKDPAFTSVQYFTAIVYQYTRQLDSALYYAQPCFDLMQKNRDPRGKIMASIIAQAYAAKGNDILADSYFQNSIDTTGNSRTFIDALTAKFYSEYLFQKGRMAEARRMALQGMESARASQAKGPLLENVAQLQNIYSSMHRYDSAFHYATLQLAYQDSLFNSDKLNAIKDMALNETLHEQEEAVKRAEAEEERQHNLQYAAIALALVTIIAGFLAFSHTAVANEKTIRFLGIVSLLILFEFLNLLLHPYIGSATHHSPVWMLVIMVVLAAILVPLHHKVEHWLTHKLVAKNNRIRLARAQRMIRELQTKESPVSEQGPA
ncbi:hypothetical protein [Flaviaesturariibacter aridisoli]|uniref:Tetratricopeptide repeat protein n=1 Tax=Flaviaesturariibacter aridisoli TaxID=2545761 RepID=A0A4R4EAM4_9BACT|nr:hypothetical protein [Flaviaesturariibacter aridisoli]TCZ74895.1 hypothetical protein E0486_00900 [Flaviaesturariibacter aridisoli]